MEGSSRNSAAAGRQLGRCGWRLAQYLLPASLPFLLTTLISGCGNGEAPVNRGAQSATPPAFATAQPATRSSLAQSPGPIAEDPISLELLLDGRRRVREGEMSGAVLLFGKAFERSQSVHDTIGMIGAALGRYRLQEQLGNLERADNALPQLLGRYVQATDRAPQLFGDCYAFLAAYFSNHDIDSARHYQELAEGLLATHPFTSTQRVHTLLASGIVKWRMGELALAQTTYEQCLELLADTLAKYDTDVDARVLRARAESGLCNVLGDLKENEAAVEHGLRALHILEPLADSSPPRLRQVVQRQMARIMQGLAGALMEEYLLDSAWVFLQRSIALNRANPSSDLFTLQAAYYNAANNRFLDRDFSKALMYVDTLKGLITSSTNPVIVAGAEMLPLNYYCSIGLCDSVLSGMDRAFTVYGFSIERDSIGLPDPYSVHSLSQAIDRFDAWSGLLGDAARKSGDLVHLKRAAMGYDRTMALVDEQVAAAEIGQRSVFMRQNWDTYRGALRMNHALYRATGETQFLDRMLRTMERSRNLRDVSLADRGRSSFPLSISNALDSLEVIDVEIAELRGAITHSGVDKTDILARLDTAMRVRQRWHESIRKADPEIHARLFGTPTVGLHEVQKKLAPGEVLVEFFTSLDNLYAVWVGKDSAIAQFIPLDTSGFNDTLSIYLDPRSSTEQRTQSGSMMARTLLEEGISALHPHSLIIVPDGQLCKLPFEALPLPDEIGHGLLIDSVAVLYETASRRMLSSSAHNGGSLTTVTAFAPVNFQIAESRDADDDIPELLATLRSGGFYDLPHTKDEIEVITGIIEGEALSNANATESEVEVMRPESVVLHFATHAFSDAEDPEYSGIVLYGARTDSLADPNRRTSSDNILYAHEIASLRLRSPLVVLSACESGSGAYARGEGVQSLARAFQVAGAKSIVSSLWKVDDLATKEIMVKFYEHLAEGMGKADALAEAKRWYRRTYPNEPASKWAAFILIGDNEPVRLKKRSPIRPWMWGAGILMVLAGGALLWQRSRRAAA